MSPLIVLFSLRFLNLCSVGTSMISLSMADFPILKNYLMTHGTPLVGHLCIRHWKDTQFICHSHECLTNHEWIIQSSPLSYRNLEHFIALAFVPSHQYP
jgi:hypothetical protein